MLRCLGLGFWGLRVEASHLNLKREALGSRVWGVVGPVEPKIVASAILRSF